MVTILRTRLRTYRTLILVPMQTVFFTFTKDQPPAAAAPAGWMMQGVSLTASEGSGFKFRASIDELVLMPQALRSRSKVG